VKQSNEGFTIVEVLIAIIMLSIGVLALSSSAGSVTRMMYTGQNKTKAYAMASSKLEELRAQTSCGSIVGGSQTGYQGVQGVALAWDVGTVSSSRVIRVVASYRNGTRNGADTLLATVYCP
jgi:prepilin-type N-terminal cleavage/methylation domain-containing protein